MKRVLNSGIIKLNNILGSEDRFIESYNRTSSFTIDDVMEHTAKSILLFFEIKAPISILQSFQKSNLGYLETFEVIDASEGYIPPKFFKQGPLGFDELAPFKCNELNTKYSNFYRNATNFYFKLLEQGVCQSEAALVLPIGIFTTFNWQISVADLLLFIEQNKNSSPELFGYSEIFMLYLEENFPKVMEWKSKI